jgi:hypothetical protein
MGKRSSITSGAIAIPVNDTEVEYGTILHATDGHKAGIHTAYGMELVMITVASTLRKILREDSDSPLRIYCDSKPAVHAAHSCSFRNTRKLASKRMVFLVQQLHRTRDENISNIRHCFSHPENRKPRHMYHNVDIGNSLADKASGPKQHLLHFPGFTRHTHTTTQLLKDLLFFGQWYIGDTNGVPYLENISIAFHDAQHE